MDRGIVSEANLATIRKREGQYLVGTPRSKRKEFEPGLQEETGWEQVRDEVQVKLIPIPGGQETFILCKTEGRQKKEQAIRERFTKRIGESRQAAEGWAPEESRQNSCADWTDSGFASAVCGFVLRECEGRIGPTKRSVGGQARTAAMA